MRWIALTAVAASLIACATTRIDLEELPGAPIAVAYWDDEAARRRIEILGRSAGPPEQHEGVARIESIGRMLGARPDRTIEAELKRYPSRLGLLDPRTLEISRLTAAPAGAMPIAWSPDHQRLLFASTQREGFVQIFEYDRVSAEVRRLTHGNRSHSVAAFGPDDRYAYFAWERDASGYHGAVYLTAPGGSSPQISFSNELVEDLSWSPDGEKLVYTRLTPNPRRDGAMVSHIVARPATAEGGEARVLSRGRGVTFTPDGEWLVYSAPSVKAGWKLRRMRVDGSSRAPLGTGSMRDEAEPAISPDGRFIAYVAAEEGIDRLFIRRFDGSGDRILYNDGAVASPVW